MKMSEFCTIHSGLSPRGSLEARPDGILAIQLSDVTSSGQLDLSSVLRIENHSASSRHLVGPGDVLFRSRGVHNFACPVPAQLTEPAVAVLPLFVIRPIPGVADAHYVAWYLNQPGAQRHFTQGAAGTNLRMIPKPVLADVEFDLPPLSTQRSIAELAALSDRAKTLGIRLANCQHNLMALQLSELVRTTSSSPTRTGHTDDRSDHSAAH